LQNYWKFGNGIEGSAEMPFYVGRIEAGVQLNPYYSESSSIPDFYAGFVYLGWGLDYSIHQRLNWYTYARVGNLQMTFDDQIIPEALRTESEFSTSLGTRFSTPVSSELNFSVSLNYLMVHTNHPLKLVIVSAGLGYAIDTPPWIREFLN